MRGSAGAFLLSDREKIYIYKQTGSGNSFRKDSHKWFDTLREDNRANNRNNALSPKAIAAAKKQNNYKPTRVAKHLKIGPSHSV